jgi:hypothetical protein
MFRSWRYENACLMAEHDNVGLNLYQSNAADPWLVWRRGP